MNNLSVKYNLGVVLSKMSAAIRLCSGVLLAVLWLFVFPASSEAATTVTIGGTVSAGTEEIKIVNGGETIAIILSDNEWAENVVSLETKCNLLFDSLVAESESSEWANVIAALKTTAGAVERNSDTKVTITLPAPDDYNITSNQTITVNVPASLLEDSSNPVKSPGGFIIRANRAAAITGTVTKAATESNIVAGGKTIIITITNDTWVADAISNTGKRDSLLDGLKATGETEGTEWIKVVNALKAAPDLEAVITRKSDTVVTITLPAISDYNITASQTITANIPKELLSAGIDLVEPAPSFTISPAIPEATLGGTATKGNSEQDIYKGGKTIVITLSNDIWAPDLIMNQAKREALFDGLEAGTEKTEWTKVVNALKAAPDPGSVITRNSDTVVTITLSATAAYDIMSDQTITLTIPASALASANEDVTAFPDFTVAPVAAVLSGTAVQSPIGKNDIIMGGKTIVITLDNDCWVSDVASNKTKRDALIEGLTADGTEGSEWNKVLTALKTSSTGVSRTSQKEVTITLPATPDYNITANQTITLRVPSDSLSSGGGGVTATPIFTVQLSTAVAAGISGTVVSDPTSEADIIAGGKTIIITLTNDTWASDIATNATNRNALLNALTSTTESAQWKKVVATLKATTIALLRNSDNVVTITLPACNGYNIKDDQIVSLTIPKKVLTTASANVTASNTFEVAAINPSAEITGTIRNATEAEIFNGGSTIIITLDGGDTWASDVAGNATKRNALLTGLVAASEDREWKKVITALKATTSSVVRSSNTEVTITLPAVNKYNITADQIVTLSIPPALLTLGNSTVVATPSLTITPVSATATLSGTMTTGTITEADIIKGGKEIAILLTKNTWVSDVASTKSKREALIDGLTTASANNIQWAKVIKGLKADPSSVQRVTDCEVIITLPPTPSYAISADEVVSLTIPKRLLGINADDMAGSPSLIIKPAGTAVLGGTIITDSPNEAEIIGGGKNLTVTLTNDTWAADISSAKDKREALFAGLTASNQTSEWTKVVNALKDAGAGAIAKNSDTVITITLPPVADYSITNRQTITLTIPQSALTLTSADVQAVPCLTIAVKMGDLLANDAKLSQLLTNHSLRQIQVTVPPKYVDTVQINHFPIETKYITSIDVLCESTVVRVAAMADGVTHENSSYSLSSGKKLFNIGFSGLAAPGDIELRVYDSYGTQLQTEITVQYVEGLSDPVQALDSDLSGTYTLYQLIDDTAKFNDILDAYTLDELIISTITG